ncbi:hypothetical protein [Streptomyces sp. NPDC101455]|uniref:hypothetical protein n=1 Tax=Streptomyces sp. NPDC101455 TaxID=3366142 RepID=UPI0037FD79D7
MDKSNARRWPGHHFRLSGEHAEAFRYLRKWLRRQGRIIPGGFLQGAAYKLGSGTVTLFVLWWETRH